MNKMIMSESLDEMVVAGFTVGGEHFTWNDDDCVYWSDDVDDEYFQEIPKNADIDKEEEETIMTREEKLYSMTMKMLVAEAEKAGVKINKKGKKEDAVNKILEAEKIQNTEKEEKTMNTAIPAEDVTEETTATKETAKKRSKTLSYTETLALIPSMPTNMNITFKAGVNARANSVIVNQKKKRLFRVVGHTDNTMTLITAKERIQVTREGFMEYLKTVLQ